MPKISIIVPIYNVERYLRDCLNSLINQTLSDIEIICVNDGSTDSSPRILEEYALKDSRIKVINKENSGYGASMNMGLAAAEGEYIGIVESDDFVKANMYEDLYNLAKENNADVVKSDWYCYWTDKKESRKSGKISFFKSNKIINTCKYKDLLKLQPSIWSAIYKREFWESNNIKFLETPGASYQDTSFTFKVFMCAPKIVLTKDAYVYYRQDNINSSCNSKDKAFAICGEFDEIDRFMSNAPELQKEFGEYVYSIQYRSYLETMLRIDEKYINDFLNIYSETFKNLYENKLLGKYFFSKNKKKDLLTLINKKEDFLAIYYRALKQKQKREQRQRLISIRCNSSRLSIVIFGKQILEIG